MEDIDQAYEERNKLFKEMERELEPLESNVHNLITSISSSKSRKDEMDSLIYENENIKEELESEERWMRRIANEALDSEENNLCITLKCLWYLSSLEQNCYEILEKEDVIKIICESVDSNFKDELFSEIFAIFGNLCQSEELCETFIEKYPELIHQMITSAKETILSAIIPSKTLQMSLIFLHNCSRNDKLAEFMGETFVFDALSNVLIDHSCIPEVIDITIRILSVLLNTNRPKILMYFSHEALTEIYHSLMKEKTQSSYLLRIMLTIKDILPSIDTTNLVQEN